MCRHHTPCARVCVPVCSRFRVVFVDPKTHEPKHTEPAVGGRLRQQAKGGGGA
jgi:hypothetical protein